MADGDKSRWAMTSRTFNRCPEAQMYAPTLAAQQAPDATTADVEGRPQPTLASTRSVRECGRRSASSAASSSSSRSAALSGRASGAAAAMRGG